DKTGKLILIETDSNVHLDGTADYNSTTYTYDKTGTLVLIEKVSDVHSDGTVDSRSNTMITKLNDFQTLIVTILEAGTNLTIKDTDTEIQTFDKEQRLIRSELQIDNASFRRIRTWDYDLENNHIYEFE